MKTILLFFCFFDSLFAAEPSQFDTQWIPSKPEVLTYRSTGSEGGGLYQVSICRKDDHIDLYMNIISPGFTKTVAGTMTSEMQPLQSTAKIIIDGQVAMDTKCFYDMRSFTITTSMEPYGRTITNSPSFSGSVLDYSQTPLLVRTVKLEKGARFKFTSLNPRTNNLSPLNMAVIGQDSTQKTLCFKVEVSDFEGTSIYWVECGNQRRVMRIEQPESKRITELIE